jgi:uncharacterized protein
MDNDRAVQIPAKILEIHKLCREGGIKRLASLLDEDPRLIDCKMADLGTPLHTAAYHGQTEIAVLLATKGKHNAFATNIDGYTPIHSAASQGHHKIVNSIASQGGPINAVANV